MKMSFSQRNKNKNYPIDRMAKAALAILDRQIAKDTPEQQERLREVRRAVILMRRLSKLQASDSGRQEFTG